MQTLSIGCAAITRAENQHGRPDFAGTDAFEDLHAVDGGIGQHEIEDHDVIIRVVDVGDSRVAVRRHIDGIAVAFEAPLQEIGDLLFVLYDKDAHSYS